MTKKNRVIAIVGPTASGKTGLAVRIAKYLNTEIISADSRQIYKDFNIAVAKPSAIEMDSVVHNLIGFVNPGEEYTVANFADDARLIIERIHSEGKIPVVVGGTGLYFRILLENFDMPRVEPDKEFRSRLEKLSIEELYAKLVEMDPVIAQKIHPNNTVKIIRALEVCNSLKIPMSQAQKVKDNPDYDVCWFGLNSENREFLYNLVNTRVDRMIQAGLEAEARKMYEKYGNLQILLDTIGYREFWDYFNGKNSFEDVVEQIKQNTRRYAKRQLTWFRRNKEIRWFDIEKMTLDDISKKIFDII